ncbi:MAG: FkbM family methyltransferase [Flavobacteriales bacterium]|nr:FkbM family methyltransferase [Flavobacteriales bacterium]
MTASAVNPDALVVAVEPVSRIFDKLKENVSLNGDRTKTVRAAISEYTGTAILFDLPEEEHVLSVSLEPDWNKNGKGIQPVEVPCLTVADLLARFDATKVDLLKIDVETHEAAVLRGFLEVLRRDKPTLLIELLNDNVAAEVAQLIGGLGYLYFNIDDVTWPPLQTKTLTKSSHFNFLICQPEVARSIGL